jgi:citrate lyase beta subunit
VSTADELASTLLGRLDRMLAATDAELAASYPGERPGRQPVHTVYVPAEKYDANLVPAYGTVALQALDENTKQFGAIVQDADIEARVRTKLEGEPVEDLRVDFEDGYGGKSETQEDIDAARAARELAESQRARKAAPFGGIRIKSFEAATRQRSIRTLTSYLTTFLDAEGSLDGWVVTLPKVTRVDQVDAMVEICARLEQALGLSEGALRFEIQIETTQSIIGPDGTAPVARMVHAGGDRLTGLHFGTYDYSASCGIAAEHQSLDHPAADHAKLVMQAAAAGTGVRLSDGSTNLLPVGDADDIAAAWANHHRLVRRSLERGFYQGWDLHPAQLPTRYAATYAFYREALPRALSRLADYTGHASSGIADEPATARALANYLLRGVQSGAVDEAEVLAGVGLGIDQLFSLTSSRPRST